MTLGMLITALSLYDLATAGFSWSVLGCAILGFYIMTHNQHHK